METDEQNKGIGLRLGHRVSLVVGSKYHSVQPD
jgi:hypothetical protein